MEKSKEIRSVGYSDCAERSLRPLGGERLVQTCASQAFKLIRLQSGTAMSSELRLAVESLEGKGHCDACHRGLRSC